MVPMALRQVRAVCRAVVAFWEAALLWLEALTLLHFAPHQWLVSWPSFDVPWARL